MLKQRPAMFINECDRFRIIAKHALDSCCYHKHVAACFKGGNLLSVGINKNTAPGRKWIAGVKCSEHAEVAAIRQLNDTKGVTLYVCRVRPDGSSGLSKPCKDCQEYIKNTDIKKVIYTIEDTFEASDELSYSRMYDRKNYRVA